MTETAAPDPGPSALPDEPLVADRGPRAARREGRNRVASKGCAGA